MNVHRFFKALYNIIPKELKVQLRSVETKVFNKQEVTVDDAKAALFPYVK
jgi:hypothetical protein